MIATQNPLEQQGTFPLPEAQLDRFLFKLNMGYPSSEESVNILKRFKDDQPLESLMAIATSERIVQARHIVSKVHVSDVILSYIVALSEHSRRMRRLPGRKPKGLPSLIEGGASTSRPEGQEFVTPDDVKELAVPTWAHRLKLRGRSTAAAVRPQRKK